MTEKFIYVPTTTKIQDLTGERFGKLTIVGFAHIQQEGHKGRVYWNIQCDCGTIFCGRADSLKTGKVQNCAKCGYKKRRVSMQTHGDTDSSEYGIWVSMKQRCLNPNNQAFDFYGGRGITICQRWIDSYEEFIHDMGRRPSIDHSLDRIKVNGNYEPGNCRWATDHEQKRNMRSNVFIEHEGEWLIAPDWAKKFGWHLGTLRHHLKKGRTIKDVLTRNFHNN